MKNFTFQEKVDANNEPPKTFNTEKEIQVLLSVIDRNNPSSPALYETQISVKFWDGEARIGNIDKKVYLEDSSRINYFIRTTALNYFCHLNYSEKPNDVQKFIDVTKNKTWCFDSVII